MSARTRKERRVGRRNTAFSLRSGADEQGESVELRTYRPVNESRRPAANLVAGILFGVIVATVAGAWATTTFKKMVAGQAATAADVNKAHQDLADAIDALEHCPHGYKKDTTAPLSITVCKKGSDAMVKVGDFWVDRYEMSIVDSGVYKSGQCNGTGKQYGTSSDDYPTTPGKGFADSGDASVSLYACSVKGNQPSVSMTWFQAALACGLAGKHLCTNAEWQLAALGTPDDGTWNLNGEAHSGAKFTTGLPAAGLRGGYWDYGTDAGVYAVRLYNGPSSWSADYGARCCRQ